MYLDILGGILSHEDPWSSRGPMRALIPHSVLLKDSFVLNLASTSLIGLPLLLLDENKKLISTYFVWAP